jgi:hypothetical protein
MIDTVATLIERIERRPASELESTIREFSKLIPEADGKPIIQIQKRLRDNPSFGKCMFIQLEINDPIMGYREFWLHVFKSTGMVDNLLSDKKEKLEKFEEILDGEGNQLFDPSNAKRAVLECLIAMHDPWVLVELQDIKVDKVTVGRHVKRFDYIRKSEHDGVYAIRKSKLHLYLTPPMVREYVG